jgi:hypothetical protein
MTDLRPDVMIALNSRRISNNNISSNEMLHHLQARAKMSSNELRQYMTHNATNIMDNNLTHLKEYQMPFHSSYRPNEFTNNVCSANGCELKLLDKNGLGQGRLCNQ